MQKNINAGRSPDAPKKAKYKFKTQPWKHQREALIASWDKEYFALLCDYGTGKTKIIIDTAGILYEQNMLSALFIIAPNEIHERWLSEQIPQHLPDRIQHIKVAWTGATTKKFKESLERFWQKKYENYLKIFSINIESLQSSKRAKNFSKNFLASFPSLLAIDESTRIKSSSAKRTQFIINHLSELAKYRRTLTGNEVTRSPFDVYSPYRFLKRSFWLPSLPDYHTFKHRYGKWKTNFTYRKSAKLKKPFTCPSCRAAIHEIKIEMGFGICPACRGVIREGLPEKVQKLIDNNGKFEYPKIIGYHNLEELRKKTQAHSYLIRKEECMDLPPKIYQPLYTEMNDEQRRIYKELKKQLATEYQGAELSVPNKIALTMRFQQIVGGFFPETGAPIGDINPKLERLLYDLEDIDTADPIIIWSRFTAELQAIAAELRKNYDKKVALYYGDTPKPERQKIISGFQEGKYGFFVANPQTAGTGLNLQRAYIHYYYSNSFNSEDRWQSEDRSHRGEQKNTCLYKDIFIKGTVDDTIKEANDKKKKLADFFRTRNLEEVV